MNNDKVVVRALQQFMYLKDDAKYEFIDIDRELEIDIERAVEWKKLDIVDVLNPYLMSGIDEYVDGFDEYKRVGNLEWL